MRRLADEHIAGLTADERVLAREVGRSAAERRDARIQELGGTNYPLSLVSRAESASPATGRNASHQFEQKILIDEAFSK